MFEVVHRRSNSLKAFHLQFRLGSFQTHDDEVQLGNSGRIAAQGFLKDGLECDSIFRRAQGRASYQPRSIPRAEGPWSAKPISSLGKSCFSLGMLRTEANENASLLIVNWQQNFRLRFVVRQMAQEAGAKNLPRARLPWSVGGSAPRRFDALLPDERCSRFLMYDFSVSCFVR